MQPRSIGTFLLAFFSWPPVSLRLFLSLVLHAEPHNHSLAVQRVRMHAVPLATAWNKQCFPRLLRAGGTLRFALFLSSEETQTILDRKDAAEAADLRYLLDERPGIQRKKSGKGFIYLRPDGTRVSDPRVLRRILSLAVPPAWTDVWICPFSDGHIQATGRDVRGRKQYRYHPLFRELRESTKFEHVMGFAEALPVIRAKVREHMGLPGLPREKVLATVVRMLETKLIRIGNDDYARENKSYGLTTLKNRRVRVNGSEVRFRFTGKGGKQWSLQVKDRRIAMVVKACQELPGQELLQYVDENGELQDVTSGDVNAYLKKITGRDITAKDFRTWAVSASPPGSATPLPSAESVTSILKCWTRISIAISRWKSSRALKKSCAKKSGDCNRRKLPCLPCCARA